LKEKKVKNKDEISIEDIPLFEEVSDDLIEEMNGKIIGIKAKPIAIRIRTYPPIDLSFVEELEDSEYVYFPREMLTELIDKKILTANGFIQIDLAGITIQDTLDIFNQISCMFNILGLPIAFFDVNDIIIIAELKDGSLLNAIGSKLADEKHSVSSLVKLTEKEKIGLLFASKYIWEAIKKLHFLRETEVYEFLAKCRYHLSFNQHRLAFIYGWIFIEAIISNIWKRNIIEKYGTKTAAAAVLDDNNFTTHIKTEELFLFGYLSKDEVKTINLLRKKRNDVFHFHVLPEEERLKEETKNDKSTHSRHVTAEDSANCMTTALKLFYKELGMDKILDFHMIRQRIFDSFRSFTPEQSDKLREIRKKYSKKK